MKANRLLFKKHLGTATALTIIASLVITMVASATAGSLDPTFGTGGLVTTEFANSFEQGNAVALQPDGKIIMAGTSFNYGNGMFALARYNSDGSLDTAFDGDGQVITSIGNSASVRSIALQPDGKIIAAGFSSIGGKNSFALARYNSDGSLDTTFDADGKVIIAIGSSNDYGYALALQQDGKIVMAGDTSISSASSDFALARFNNDGSLDITFDGDGKVTTDFGASNDSGFSIAIQADGRILVAGTSAFNFALARYNGDGSLDSTFDTDGKVTTDFSNNRSDYAYSMVLQSDGKIVLAGSSNNGIDADFALARYNPDGLLDTTFDGDGKASADHGSGNDEVGNSVAIQSDGMIVLAGHTFDGNDAAFALIRFDSSGSLDLDFGTSGRVTTEFSSLDSAQALVIQTDGRIIAAGDNYEDFALARYDPDGSLNTTFDTDGKVTTAIENSEEYATDIALQPDGKFVVAGISFRNTDTDFALARYNSNGSLDSTFDTDGKVITDFSSHRYDYANSLVIQPDGKIVVAGGTDHVVSYDFALARYNSDGSLDTSFDTDGKLTTDLGGNDDAAVVLLQQDGMIIVAGYSTAFGNYDFALARYNTNGSLDTTFDMDGKVTMDFGSNSSDHAISMAIQPDGKIVVAGSSYDGTNNKFALARYNPDGSLDTTFDTDGKVITDFGIYHAAGLALAIQTDGKIVVTGYSGNDTNSFFALARYNSNGSLDTTFDGDGKVITDFSVEDLGADIAIESDGKIVVAGISSHSLGTGPYYFALARYNSDGSLDTTFDGDGKATTDFGSHYDSPRSIDIQPDDRIVVAGSVWNGNNEDFAVARFNVDATHPTVTSIARMDSNPSSASIVDFMVTFSESVRNVDPEDFTLTTTSGISGASVSSIGGAGSTRTVTVNTGSGNGTIRLDVPIGATITDLDGDLLGDLPFTSGETYIVYKAPSAATLVSPTGNIGTNYIPGFTWNTVSGATWYYLWISGPSGKVLDQWYPSSICSTGTCSVPNPVTLSSSNYTWWVQTWNPVGYGSWSTGMDFTVTPPPAATLTSPINNADFSTNYTPTFTWNSVNGATWYYLWVNGPSGNIIQQWFTSVQANCNSSTCFVTPSTSMAAGSHTWWVQTWSPAGYGQWSSAGTFHTSTTPPPAATLVSPNTNVGSNQPTYTWNQVSAATYYYLWVDGPGGNKIKQWFSSAQASCNGSTCSVTPSTTLSAGAHTWWIQTWNPAGYGQWSTGMSFTTVVPTAATLVSPDVTGITNPTYTWNQVSTATYYYLWVDGPGGNKIQKWYTSAEASCNGTTCSITGPVTLGSGAHTWWVQTWNSVGYGPWSASKSFSVP